MTAPETLRPSTHLGIDARLCGRVEALAPGRARVSLETVPEMAVDALGLVHGGFVFGLADYAAMLAVNDPNVVLGAAEAKFEAPVRLGERLLAEAELVGAERRKREVTVTVAVGERRVFTGTFTCFVLDRHVLATEG